PARSPGARALRRLVNPSRTSSHGRRCPRLPGGLGSTCRRGPTGRVPTAPDEGQRLPEVLRVDEGPSLRELVLDRRRIDVHLSAHLDEGLAFRQLLSDVRLQEPEAPIDAPRERGPRALDLALLEGGL